MRVHPYGDPWPVQMEGLNSQQRIRNWQKVLAGKKADSLEAALLMAALKNAVAEDLKFCLVLFALPANPEKDEEEKRFLLAWSPRGRVWQAIEIAWAWLRYQPHSKLSQWFSGRIANGGSRMRRIGIVALARRLLVDLWRFLEYGVVPEGALLTS